MEHPQPGSTTKAPRQDAQTSQQSCTGVRQPAEFTNPSTPTTLLDLPKDVLLYVCTFIHGEDLIRLGATNRELRASTNCIHLWRGLAESTLPKHLHDPQAAETGGRRPSDESNSSAWSVDSSVSDLKWIICRHRNVERRWLRPLPDLEQKGLVKRNGMDAGEKVSAVHISQDESYIVSGGASTVTLWTKDDEAKRFARAHSLPSSLCHGMAIKESTRLIFSASENWSIYIDEIVEAGDADDDGSVPNAPLGLRRRGQLDGHIKPVLCVDSIGDTVVSGSWNSFRVWNGYTGQCIQVHKNTHRGAVFAIVAPQPHIIITGSADRTVAVSDDRMPVDHPVGFVPGSHSAVYSLRTMGNTILSGGSNNFLNVNDLRNLLSRRDDAMKQPAIASWEHASGVEGVSLNESRVVSCTALGDYYVFNATNFPWHSPDQAKGPPLGCPEGWYYSSYGALQGDTRAIHHSSRYLVAAANRGMEIIDFAAG